MPPLAPTSPALTVDVLLKNPQIIRRRLTDLTYKRFVADRVFMKGSPEQVAGGGARYQRSESIFFESGRDVEKVGFRSEFPRAGWSEAILEAYVKAYGLEFPINDLAIRRNAIDMVERGLIKLSNGLVRYVDTVAMTLLQDTTQGVQTFAAGGDWTTAATDIIFDLNRARQAIETQEEGYVADTVIVNDAQFADLLNDADIRLSMPRESRDSFIQTGVLPNLLGFDIIRTQRLTAGVVIVMNSKVAGTIADEEPSEGGYSSYQPGDPSQTPIWTKQYREEPNSDTIIRGVRWPAMWLAEPKSVVKITGA